MQSCKACGAPVVWVTTPKGKKMPLDTESEPAGTFVYVGDPADCKVGFIGDKPYAGDRFTSHFATCPNANEFRSK